MSKIIKKKFSCFYYTDAKQIYPYDSGIIVVDDTYLMLVHYDGVILDAVNFLSGSDKLQVFIDVDCEFDGIKINGIVYPCERYVRV